MVVKHDEINFFLQMETLEGALFQKTGQDGKSRKQLHLGKVNASLSWLKSNNSAENVLHSQMASQYFQHYKTLEILNWPDFNSPVGMI